MSETQLDWVGSVPRWDGDGLEAQVSEATGLRCDDPSLTQQSQAEDADINVLVRRFGLTGQMPESVRLPVYMDFDEVFDFATAQRAVLAARQQFMQIPADVRSRFDNDPQKFLEFCTNVENLPEMRKLGLAKPEPEAVPPAPVGDVKV